MLGGLIKFIKDSLFPVFCVGCKKEGEWWCDKCRAEEKVGVFVCPVCHVETNLGKTCEKCKNATALDGALAIFNFVEEKPVGELIHRFKYSFALDMQTMWEKIIEENFLATVGKLGDGWLILPVPLYPKRKRERGFNQSEVIARILERAGRNNDWLYQDCLRRLKPTRQQAKLTKAEREENVRGAFGCFARLARNKILLVDDVFTTGSTMNECAIILRHNGAREVWGFTLARG